MMMTLSKCLLLEQALFDFHILSLTREIFRSYYSRAEVLPKDRTLASSHSVKPKEDVVQQVPDPKGKDKDVREYALPSHRPVATPPPYSHTEGSGSSHDPLSTPNGIVSSSSLILLGARQCSRWE